MEPAGSAAPPGTGWRRCGSPSRNWSTTEQDADLSVEAILRLRPGGGRDRVLGWRLNSCPAVGADRLTSRPPRGTNERQPRRSSAPLVRSAPLQRRPTGGPPWTSRVRPFARRIPASLATRPSADGGRRGLTCSSPTATTAPCSAQRTSAGWPTSRFNFEPMAVLGAAGRGSRRGMRTRERPVRAARLARVRDVRVLPRVHAPGRGLPLQPDRDPGRRCCGADGYRPADQAARDCWPGNPGRCHGGRVGDGAAGATWIDVERADVRPASPQVRRRDRRDPPRVPARCYRAGRGRGDHPPGRDREALLRPRPRRRCAGRGPRERGSTRSVASGPNARPILGRATFRQIERRRSGRC